MSAWPADARLLTAASVLLMYAAMCAAIVVRERRSRRATQREAAALAGEGASWLVLHASQTGSAEQIAWQTARALHTAGVGARLVSMSAVTEAELSAATQALFIVSTYGEGDPPDAAAPFVRRWMNSSTSLDLSHLRVGVLALGDAGYAQFCGFGRRLDAWLHEQGALPMFERIEANRVDEAALRHWQQQLAHVAGTSDLDDWRAPAYAPWRLVKRTHLNPGSAGGSAFHIELEAIGGTAHWQAGDLAQIRLPDDPQHPREYSIASLPLDGRLHLLVRQQRRDDGRLGLASGWLTHHAALGDTVELRVREHRNFRIGDNIHRPLVLIGNGTGFAGLRAHLKARALQPLSRNWLIFGERNAAHDAFHADEIAAWKAHGVLERADLVYSRDGNDCRYVQDRLREAAVALRHWLADGAAVYVCGSLQGMAAGVEAALVEIAGQDGVNRLIAEGRYRRDVY